MGRPLLPNPLLRSGGVPLCRVHWSERPSPMGEVRPSTEGAVQCQPVRPLRWGGGPRSRHRPHRRPTGERTADVAGQMWEARGGGGLRTSVEPLPPVPRVLAESQERPMKANPPGGKGPPREGSQAPALTCHEGGGGAAVGHAADVGGNRALQKPLGVSHTPGPKSGQELAGGNRLPSRQCPNKGGLIPLAPNTRNTV
eukprot:GHVN01067954.1.p2 GENE.GHVN01067954.1~~GHVN01067954.1.p2  ORF type:complete len:198 (+),score=12.68 GHVN01067954.1:1307-1900(+)